MDELYESEISRWKAMVKADRQRQKALESSLPPVGKRVCRTCNARAIKWSSGRNCMQCHDCWYEEQLHLGPLLGGCLRVYNSQTRIREGPCVKCGNVPRQPMPADGICDDCLQKVIIDSWNMMRQCDAAAAAAQ